MTPLKPKEKQRRLSSDIVTRKRKVIDETVDKTNQATTQVERVTGALDQFGYGRPARSIFQVHAPDGRVIMTFEREF